MNSPLHSLSFLDRRGIGPSSSGEPGQSGSVLLDSNSCASCNPSCCSCSRFFIRKIFGIFGLYRTLHSILLFVFVTVFQNSQVSITSHFTVSFLASLMFIWYVTASGTCGTVGRCERTETSVRCLRHRCPNRSAPARARAGLRPRPSRHLRASARNHRSAPHNITTTHSCISSKSADLCIDAVPSLF